MSKNDHLGIHVNYENIIDIYEDCFVTNNQFFSTSLWISKYFHIDITYVQLVWPVDQEQLFQLVGIIIYFIKGIILIKLE